MDYPIQRNIDIAYFRVSRNGVVANICFTDLTESEQQAALQRLNSDELKQLVIKLSKVVSAMGELFNFKMENTAEDNEVIDLI